MEIILSVFKVQQFQVSDVLGKLIQFFECGSVLGIMLELLLIDKFVVVCDGIVGEKFKVVLIGGFFEGKIFIVVVWLEQFDEVSMKISYQEFFNEVKVYDVGDDFMLIDMLGLFGFKDWISVDIYEVEKYKDIIWCYVSQVYLVLYVMNLVNLVKESYCDELIWLFCIFDLLLCMVFVLSCFDDVVDVEDEQSYQVVLVIKCDNVVGCLIDLFVLDVVE